MNLQSPISNVPNYASEFYRERLRQVKRWQTELDKRLDLSHLLRAQLIDLDEQSQILRQKLNVNESEICMLQKLIDGES